MDTTERLHFHFSFSCIGEGNGNPLQYSCLENPRDGGAWWAAFYGVAQSRTRLKRLSSSSSRQKYSSSFLKWKRQKQNLFPRMGMEPWGGFREPPHPWNAKCAFIRFSNGAMTRRISKSGSKTHCERPWQVVSTQPCNAGCGQRTSGHALSTNSSETSVPDLGPAGPEVSVVGKRLGPQKSG